MMVTRVLAFAVALLISSSCSAVTIAAAKKIVADGLKDPSSVKFRNVKLYKRTGAVCGEFNAKNAFGGYVGFAPFGIDADGSALDAPNLEGLNGSYAEAAMREFIKRCEGTE